MTRARDLASNSSGSKPTLIDAKADLIVGTGADAASRLAVGSNGDTIVADSADTTGLRWQGNYAAGKNKIINGHMQIDQRNNGSAVSVNGNDIYTLDRFKGWANGGGVYSVQRSTTAPAGFSYSALLTVTTADASVAAGDNYRWAQAIEGFNVADLNFGTANAATISVSFWARSNLTGTYGGAIYSPTGTRSYVYSYTISAADTWEKKTITLTGDTTGTWPKDTGIGMVVYFDLGSGSNYQNATGSWVGSEKFTTSGNANWIGTLNNNLYITGVQLEKGNVSTAFQTATGTIQGELAAAMRYFQAVEAGASYGPFGSAFAFSTNTILFNYGWKVKMRTNPTVTYSAAADFATYDKDAVVTAGSTIGVERVNAEGLLGYMTVAGSPYAGGEGLTVLANAGASAKINASSEL